MDHDGPMSWDSDHSGHEADEYGREPEGELPLDHSDVEPPSGEPSYDDTGHDDHTDQDQHDGQHDGLGLEYADLSGDSGDTSDSGDQPYDDAGHDDAPHDAHDAVDAHHEQDPDVAYAEPVDGSHPDLDTVGDHPGWSDDPFPPQLDMGEPPEPVDGFPWSDATVLGDEHDTSGTAADYQPTFDQPPAGDLVAYDAQEVPAGEDPWRAMAGSDDPATSSLARFWGP